MEQYYDMLFPDDEEKGKPSFKLLQMAHAWRARQAAAAAFGGGAAPAPAPALGAGAGANGSGDAAKEAEAKAERADEMAQKVVDMASENGIERAKVGADGAEDEAMDGDA